MKKAFDRYISLGLKCLPTTVDKMPLLKDSWLNGIDDFSRYKGANGIGILCGKVSGSLECIDFDNHFGDAKETLSSFISQARELYDKYKFPIESTVSGGFHLIYRCETINGNTKLAQKPKLDKTTNKFKPDTIIETRGEGGYFVTDPTKGYKWIRNDINQIPTITPEERTEIFELCRSFNIWVEPQKETFEGKDSVSSIFNQSDESLDEVANELLKIGWKEVRKGLWRRPDKDRGYSATLGKVAGNSFYVFSDNAYPFEINTNYTPYQVISILRFDGDFKPFAKELGERYNIKPPPKKDFKQIPAKQMDISELDTICERVLIDVTIPVAQPPVIMKIRDKNGFGTIDRRLFTLGNFSAITGKSKAKKSFFAALLLAAATKCDFINNKLCGYLPISKSGVILFDTEQSDYDVYRYAKNVCDILGGNYQNFGAFALREFSPIERCQIIDHIITKHKNNLGYIVIDGIADLATAINDELEATRVVSLLMKWTKLCNCHITVNIHQNKNDNYATGHLGSAIMKKAECIISLFKDENEPSISKVECTDIRGTMEFGDFIIRINEFGIPVIESDYMTTKIGDFI